MTALSRRAALFLVGMLPSLPQLRAGSLLVSLGHQFDEITARLDDAMDNGQDISSGSLFELTRIEEQILNKPATTIEEFCVKARVACWALLGDLDHADNSTADSRAALSIIRDLIRLHRPSLERPGALKKLVES